MFIFQEDAASSPRKVDLKRGRHFVDKNKEKPHFLMQSASSGNLLPKSNTSDTSLKRNDSLTKKEKQDENEATRRRRQNNNNNNNNNNNPATAKLLKTLANQKRIRRRHTVGGTKDFAEWDAVVREQEEAKKEEEAARLERSLMAYLLRASSPDLGRESNKTAVRRRRAVLLRAKDDPRRLSLPADGKPLKMPSLLESKV